MITNIDKETIAFLCAKKITFNQFCICLMIHYEDLEGIIKYTAEIGYLTGGSVMKPNKKVVKELDDLLDRGFLSFKGQDRYDLDNYEVTEKFTKGFLDTLNDKAKQLWNAYPAHILFGSDPKPVAKAVMYDDFEELYLKLLKQDVSVHETVMGVVKKLTSAPMKIDKFVGSRHWENIQDVKRNIRIH
jgi:hypothetical protein